MKVKKNVSINQETVTYLKELKEKYSLSEGVILELLVKGFYHNQDIQKLYDNE